MQNPAYEFGICDRCSVSSRIRHTKCALVTGYRRVRLRSIIFAMANPDHEISPPDARAARPDAIIATGRSDYPNQVNNVLCFPFIFRGALDVRATAINEEMKIAAARAIADLAGQQATEDVARTYVSDKRTSPAKANH